MALRQSGQRQRQVRHTLSRQVIRQVVIVYQASVEFYWFFQKHVLTLPGPALALRQSGQRQLQVSHTLCRQVVWQAVSAASETGGAKEAADPMTVKA